MLTKEQKDRAFRYARKVVIEALEHCGIEPTEYDCRCKVSQGTLYDTQVLEMRIRLYHGSKIPELAVLAKHRFLYTSFSEFYGFKFTHFAVEIRDGQGRYETLVFVDVDELRHC